VGIQNIKQGKEFESVDDSCEIFYIPSGKVTKVWPEIYPLLDKCHRYSNGELETQDFLNMIVEGNMHLWVAVEDGVMIAAVVSEFVIYPRKKIMRIVSLGGKGVDRWLEKLYAVIEATALSVGCTGLEAWGRKGWERKLKDWSSTYRLYTKNIKDRLQ